MSEWCALHGQPRIQCGCPANLFSPPQPEAHARRSDPETSHAAAASLSADRLRASQQEVLTIVRLDGPIHDERLVAIARTVGLAQSVSGLRTRRSELVALGLVKDSGQRVTLRSGRASILWCVT